MSATRRLSLGIHPSPLYIPATAHFTLNLPDETESTFPPLFAVASHRASLAVTRAALCVSTLSKKANKELKYHLPPPPKVVVPLLRSLEQAPRLFRLNVLSSSPSSMGALLRSHEGIIY